MSQPELLKTVVRRRGAYLDVELLPVIELEPGPFSTHERSLPSGTSREVPDEWGRYWFDSLADSGVTGLQPLSPGSWLVPTRHLTNDVILARILSVLLRDWNATEVFSDLEYPPALDGGLALCCDNEVQIEPTCCGDLGNISDWREAAGYRGEDWEMLWIGHPWLSVRFEAPWLMLSEPHESEPIGRWAVSPDELSHAIATAEKELQEFAQQRLEPAMESIGIGSAAAPLARKLAGLNT